METVKWKSLKFTVHDFEEETKWPKVGGLYVFAELDEDDEGIFGWYALYVGETGNFADRFSDHDAWDHADLMGATHVLLRVIRRANTRRVLEAKMIQDLQPPLNVRYKQN